MDTQDFYLQLLYKAMEQKTENTLKQTLQNNYRETIADQSVSLLNEIRKSMENTELSDFACIDEIIDLFYQYGIRIIDRHDTF